MLINQAVYVTCSKWKVKMFTWQKCVPQMHKPLFMFQNDVDQNTSASFAHMASMCVFNSSNSVHHMFGSLDRCPPGSCGFARLSVFIIVSCNFTFRTVNPFT